MSLVVWLPMTKDLRQQGLSSRNVTNTGATFNSNGKLGGCYIFDGTDDAIGIGDLNNICPDGNFSFACWFYKSEFSSKGYDTIFGGPSGFELETKNGTTNSNVIVPWNWGKPQIAYEFDKWYHLVMTRTSSGTTYYLNGEQVATGTAGTIPAGNYFIGAWNTATQQNFKGKVCDVRIYDHCLSPMEVKRISQGLVLHYPLSDKNIEPTINLVPNPINFNGWNSYTNGYTSIGPNDLGGQSLICTNTTTWCGAYVSITLPSTGTYTLSCWVKPISRTSTAVNQTIYTHGGGISDTSQVVSWSNPGKWQRISMTRTYTNTSITFYLIAFGGTQTTDKVSCEWTLPQIEKLDHMTPFVNGTRNQTTIYDTSGCCNNGIITGDLTVSEDTPKYSVSTHFPSGTAYINAGQNAMLKEEVTVSLWMKYSTFDNPISCTEGGGWNFEALSANNKNLSFAIYVSGNYQNAVSDVPIDSLKNEWHMITGTCDRKYTKIYIDGELRGTTTCTGSGNIGYASNSIFIGGEAGGSTISPASSNFVGEMSDVRIYATALSADDVKSLYQNTATIDADGTIHGAVR